MGNANALSPDQIAGLLAKDTERKYPIPVQKGPIKIHDSHDRCVKRRCGSPTYYTFKGIRYCVPHLVEEANVALNGD